MVLADSRRQFMDAVFRMKRAVPCCMPSNSLQPSEFVVLWQAATGCVSDCGGFNVAEVQQVLHISRPAVSQTLNSLEKKGYIVRSIDSGDRRKILVTVTMDGKEELEDILKSQNAALERVYEQLGEERIQEFIQLANQVIDILEQFDTARADNNRKV
ncbi:MAG: MarR family winged helix-turn-helix transcriptional regulator [Blautia sp.]